MRRIIRAGVYGLTSLIGLLAFTYPFFTLQSNTATGIAHAGDSPLLLVVLGVLCLAAILLEIGGAAAMDAKFVALLGVLVSLNAVLSFLETAIPGPGGFSPIFFLIILTGYVFGARLGFLMGALTLAVSALLTGGLGPWLPFQMLTAGWVGLSAPLVGLVVRPLRLESSRGETAVLAGWGALWGLLFGAIMNLWFWPFAMGPADQHWAAGLTAADTLRRYAAFYAATSLLWDLARSAGTAALLLLFGRPTLRTMRRFRRRFSFAVGAAGEPTAAPEAAH
jgi:energy-coupling factor transport system substrate-specific component